MFGGPFLFGIVWKILFENPCLNRVFWNHLKADFKQQNLKNVFGGPFLFGVVWKILFKNLCLNKVFWNHLEADFKQQNTSFNGTSVINWTLLCGPTWSTFFQVCLLSLLSSLHARILSTWYEDHTVSQSNPKLSPTSITPLTDPAPLNPPTHHTVSQFTPHHQPQSITLTLFSKS